MGNSFVTKIGPPQCKHEFLNEYNDRYFDRVQARNSTQPSKKRWNCMMWKRAAEGVDKEEGQEWPLPRPQLTMTVSTLSTNSTAPPSCMSSPTSTVIPEEDKEDELDLSFESTWEPLHTSAVRLFPSATTSNDSPFSSSSSPPTRSYPAPQGRIQTNSTTEDWQVKQKGDALQLGLSKNRFLQLAATANDTLPRDIQPKGDITAVAFSRSNGSEVSSYLAYSTEDCSLTIMTTKDLKAIFKIEFAKSLRTLAFSSSNNYLALGGDEGVLYVLSVPSRSIIFTTIFNSTITTVAFSRHDERLSIGTRDGELTMLCPDANWEPVGEVE